MLRRTKQSQIDGKPIVDLPPRHQELVKTRECCHCSNDCCTRIVASVAMPCQNWCPGTISVTAAATAGFHPRPCPLLTSPFRPPPSILQASALQSSSFTRPSKRRRGRRSG